MYRILRKLMLAGLVMCMFFTNIYCFADEIGEFVEDYAPAGLPMDIQKIDRVLIRNGNDGQAKLFTTKDYGQQISELAQFFNSSKYCIKTPQGYGGYSYIVEFYQGNDLIFSGEKNKHVGKDIYWLKREDVEKFNKKTGEIWNSAKPLAISADKTEISVGESTKLTSTGGVNPADIVYNIRYIEDGKNGEYKELRGDVFVAEKAGKAEITGVKKVEMSGLTREEKSESVIVKIKPNTEIGDATKLNTSSGKVLDNKNPAASKSGAKKVIKFRNSDASMNISAGGENKKITMDAVPFIQDGRIMIPLRYTAEAMNMKIDWLQDTATVMLKDEKNSIEIPIHSNTITVNNNKYTSDVKPILKNGRVYVSIGNLAEALNLEEGKGLRWDDSLKEVTILW